MHEFNPLNIVLNIAILKFVQLNKMPKNSKFHNTLLVRLWSTYRVHFCRRHRRRRRRRPQHRPIGMYDSSNESSQRTE